MQNDPFSSPAQRVIRKFGGPRKLAAALRLPPSTVYRWTYPRSRRGTDGLIPHRRHAAILKAALEMNVAIEKSDLVA